MMIEGFSISAAGVWIFPAILTHTEIAKIGPAFWQKSPTQGEWLLDFAAVDSIDSAFLALLLEILREAQRKNLSLSFFHLKDKIQALLEVYGIFKLFENYIK